MSAIQWRSAIVISERPVKIWRNKYKQAGSAIAESESSAGGAAAGEIWLKHVIALRL